MTALIPIVYRSSSDGALCIGVLCVKECAGIRTVMLLLSILYIRFGDDAVLVIDVSQARTSFAGVGRSTGVTSAE